MRYPDARASSPDYGRARSASPGAAPAVPDARSGEMTRDTGPSAPVPQYDRGFEALPRRQSLPRLSSFASTAGPSAERLARADAARLRSARGVSTEFPSPAVDRDAILQRYRNASPESAAAQRAREGSGQRSHVDPAQARMRSQQGLPSSTGADARAAGRGSNAANSTDPRQRASSGRSAATPSAEATRRFIEAESSVIDERSGRIRLARARERTEALRREAAVNSPRFREAQAKGAAVARATDIAIAAGFSTVGCYYPGTWCSPYPCSSWYFWWGFGCYPYSWYCHPFGWSYWWWWGCWPYSMPYWYSYPYYTTYSYPALYYPTVIYNYGYDTGAYEEPAAAQVYEEPQPAPQPQAEPVGEASAPPARAGQTDQAAANQFLSLGDQAFREGRYADAVHYYARAVELAPGQGVLYLVLADGLFATGDYHYGAYALRKALDLDPALALTDVDKRNFYGDPTEFDRQLVVLEQYVRDRPESADARLMLAANYLFGGRPAAAVELLEREENTELRRSVAGSLILDASRKSGKYPSRGTPTREH